jgi:hypothetical protein
LSQRALIVIDTAGVEFERSVAQVKHIAPQALAHVVLAADSSTVTIKRVRQAFEWDSVMVSKLDEASQPWPLLQALCDSPLPMSLMGPSARLSGPGFHSGQLAARKPHQRKQCWRRFHARCTTDCATSATRFRSGQASGSC